MSKDIQEVQPEELLTGRKRSWGDYVKETTPEGVVEKKAKVNVDGLMKEAFDRGFRAGKEAGFKEASKEFKSREIEDTPSYPLEGEKAVKGSFSPIPSSVGEDSYTPVCDFEIESDFADGDPIETEPGRAGLSVPRSASRSSETLGLKDFMERRKKISSGW